ncbi:MAG: hypothetical protein P8099_12705 [Gemmatimonadota bacterium]|jgi:transcriptional regulator with XRE-family HTH domain
MERMEAATARERLGFSPEQLAAELGVTEAEVEAWEAGRMAVPKSAARRLAWRAALAERKAALAASGLPECDWLKAWEAEPVPTKMKERVKRLEAANAHAAACPVCKARADYVKQHLPPLPEQPVPAWAGALRWFMAKVQLLPKWARPAAYGGALIGGIVVIRAALAGLAVGFSFHLLETAGAGIGIGVYMGAVGGIAYHLVREPFRAFGRAGDYLTGIVCMFAYLLAIGVPVDLLTNDPDFRGLTSWIVFSGVAVVFGLVIGHTWFRTT